MNILITGADGQLGKALRRLTEVNPIGGCTFFFVNRSELDICDRQQIHDILLKYGVDVVINCAAYTAVDKAESEEKQCRKVNVEGVQNLAIEIESIGASLIHISSDYVFDGKNYMPYKEEDSTSPLSVYGASKRDGERVALENCRQTMVIRTSWLYGVEGKNFVKTMIRLAAEKDVLRVVCDQVGSPTFADDLAMMILSIIQKDMVRGIYHFANEGVCSWYDFAKHIMKCIGSDKMVMPIPSLEYPTPACRPYYSVLDKQKIKKEYEVDIPYWQDSLMRCITLMKENK